MLKLKMHISTSVWSLQHPNAGQNIQQTSLVFSFSDRQSEPLLRLDAKDRSASNNDVTNLDGGCPPSHSPTACGTFGSSPMASSASGPCCCCCSNLLVSFVTIFVNFVNVLRRNSAKSRDLVL